MSVIDFAIVGSDPLSAVLAGLLAGAHGQRVVLLKDRAASERLPRTAYLSCPLATRPETFALAGENAQEVRQLLTSIAGRHVLANVSPLCVAQSEAGSAALGHMMHMAGYFGWDMDRVGGDSAYRHSAYRIRGAHWVRPRLLWASLGKWLEKSGVTVRDAGNAEVQNRRDGSARVSDGVDIFDAGQLVLSDGEALLQYGHKADLGQHFMQTWATALLTEPAEMQEQVVLEPGTGFCGWRQANGTIAAIAPAAFEATCDLVATNLDAPTPLRRAGVAAYRTVTPRIPAPLVGRLVRSGVWAVAGLGMSGLHLAPSAARLMVGRARDAETRYFEARSPATDRTLVADMGAIAEETVA